MICVELQFKWQELHFYALSNDLLYVVIMWHFHGVMLICIVLYMKINAAIHGILLALKKTSFRITPINYIP
jgi:hypothetical protein